MIEATRNYEQKGRGVRVLAENLSIIHSARIP
jgi:hypothetical protein